MNQEPDDVAPLPAATDTEATPKRPRRRRSAAAPQVTDAPDAPTDAPGAEAGGTASADTPGEAPGGDAAGPQGDEGGPPQRARRKRRRGRKGRGPREEGAAAAPTSPVEPLERPPMPDAGDVFTLVQDAAFDADAGDEAVPDPSAGGDEVAQAEAAPASAEPSPDAATATERRILAPEVDAPKLQKVLAQSGVGSRRDLEQMIADGRVSVNGEVAHTGQRVSWGDQVAIDGKPVRVRIAPLPTRVLAYHKPVGEVCTLDDPEGRPTVFRRLPRLVHGKWQSVGRLDINTEGLLLFTTSGELANRLMHPRFGIEREYAVRVLGTLSDESRQRLLDGVPIDGQPCAFLGITDGGGEGVNRWYRVTIAEGRHREVRRLFEAVGMAVSRLIRIRYGTVVLPRGLKRGVAVDLSGDDVRLLRQMTGLGEGRPGRGKAGTRDKPRASPPAPAAREPRPPREPREAREPRERQPHSHEAHVIVKKRRGGKHTLHEGFGDAALRAREHEFPDQHEELAPDSAEFNNIPNPLQQTFDRRAIQEERRPKRAVAEHDDDNSAPIPNPLQQTFDQRALKAARTPQREIDDDAPIPNPLQQTYDKRFNKTPPKAGGGGAGGVAGARGGRGKKRGGGGGGGAKAAGTGAQPDPMRTAVGYIGADAYLNKKSGGGRRKRGR